MNVKATIKDNWPILLGGAAGLYLVIKFVAPKPASSGVAFQQQYVPVASPGQTSSAESLQLQLLNAQMQDAQIAREKAYDLEMAKLNAQMDLSTGNLITGYNESLGTLAQSAGAAYAGILNAAVTLPANTIMAMSNENQAALKSAAAVSAQGIASGAQNLESAAGLLHAAYAPIQYMGATMSDITKGLAEAGANSINALTSQTAATVNANAQVASMAMQASGMLAQQKNQTRQQAISTGAMLLSGFAVG